MATPRPDGPLTVTVARLVALLHQHDQEERRLIQRARRQGALAAADWTVHDRLERVILWAFAEATDAEGMAAIDAYDQEAATPPNATG